MSLRDLRAPACNRQTMLSSLATSLREQHALMALQIARARCAGPAEVVAACRHVMRSVYAHLSAFKQLVIPALRTCAGTEQVQTAIESVATALTAMAVADGSGDLEGLDDVVRSLNALIVHEKLLLATSASCVSDELLRSVASDVEEHFEALYGREQAPQADWASTRH